MQNLQRGISVRAEADHTGRRDPRAYIGTQDRQDPEAGETIQEHP
nr:MAG TPA: hypothetical protein [Caudoviricetes sp.]